MEKLKRYMEMQKITIPEAAKQIGISRPLLYYALNGNPLGKKSARKVEKWSDGFIRAVDLIQLYDE